MSGLDAIFANQPIVIDNGSGMIKCGFAGDNQPKCVFANYVGRPRHERVMAGALEGDLFIGPKAQQYRGLMSIQYPMEHGIVTNWNDMEAVWQYCYSQEQLSTFPGEHPVLLTEAALNPRNNKERAAEIFFETFNVPALHFQMQAVLALYASGRTTGTVLDSGDGVTHVVPIFEGFAVENSIMRIDLAGRDVTHYLRLLLRKEGVDLHRSAEFEIDEAAAETERVDYKLPDNTTLKLGPCRYRAPEVLFRPDLIGEEWQGVHECVVMAIQKADCDMRASLYQSIVLSGGTTLMAGFGDRLLGEVKKIAPKDMKLRIWAPKDRQLSTWEGGSILAGLDTFRTMWVSKREYDDQGKSRFVSKKFM